MTCTCHAAGMTCSEIEDEVDDLRAESAALRRERDEWQRKHDLLRESWQRQRDDAAAAESERDAALAAQRRAEEAAQACQRLRDQDHAESAALSAALSAARAEVEAWKFRAETAERQLSDKKGS
jgi:chromosome segregation ATPase